MDPLAQAMQMLQKANDVIALLSEELASAKGGKKEEGNPANNQSGEMQKTASEVTIASVFSINPDELPEFAKYASIEDARLLRKSIEDELSFGTLGKTAEINDGKSAYSNPAEALNARLAEILES